MSGRIRGRYAQAACTLIDELRRLGISAAVGYTTSRFDADGRQVKVRDKTLQVEPHAPLTPEQRERVPQTWCGFTVTVAAGPAGEV